MRDSISFRTKPCHLVDHTFKGDVKHELNVKNLGLQNEFQKQELNSAQVQQSMQNWESLFWLPYELSGICP